MSRELIAYVALEYDQATCEEVGLALGVSTRYVSAVLGVRKATARDWKISKDRGNTNPDPAMVSIIRKRLGERGRAAA